MIPEGTHPTAKTRKFSYEFILAAVLLYSLIVALAGFILFGLSPLNSLVFSGGSKLSRNDIKSVNELNDRMKKLSDELEKLKSGNEKLKRALKLGDSTLFSRDVIVNKKSGGNILAVFRDLILELTNIQKETISFIKPINGFISRDFSPGNGHMGIDFVVKTGTPVYAAANGFIIFSEYTVKDGNMIIISHPGDYITVYKHCSSLIKKQRDSVLQGELIALSGNSGEISTGPHLHFEIWKNGKPLNPVTILIK